MENIEILALELVDQMNDCLIATIGRDGFPIIAGMIKIKNVGIKKIILSTNLYTEKVKNIESNSNVSIYFYEPLLYKGCLLKGTATIKDNTFPLEIIPDGISKDNLCIIEIYVTEVIYYSNFTKSILKIKQQRKNKLI